MRLGYRRTVSDDGTMDLQHLALQAAGCSVIFEDLGVSGVHPCKRGLAELLEKLRPGDVVVIWQLDRLARDLTDVLEVVAQVLKLGAGLISLRDCIDSDVIGADGLLVVVQALLAHRGHVDAERALAERQWRIDALRGPGRPGSVSDAQWVEARDGFKAGESVTRVAGRIGVSAQALYRKRNAEGA